VTYADSSALVPLYVPGSFSATAWFVIRDAGQVPFTALHQLEVPNAFELLAGRRLISRDESRAILRQLQDDVESQRLTPTVLDLEQIFIEAGELSRRYTARFLARSLDLLHVAAAHLTLCETFVSADDRQLAVAKASGLTVVDIKRPPRRRKA
jgi:predicted nucleic acid-binding protein